MISFITFICIVLIYSSSRCSNVRVKLVSGSSAQKVPQNVFEAVTLIHRRADHNNDPDIPFSNLKVMAVYDAEAGKKGVWSFVCFYPFLFVYQ